MTAELADAGEVRTTADDLFARIRPVTGPGMKDRCLAVWGEGAAPLVMALAGCGVRHWLVQDGDATDVLHRAIVAHYGPGLDLAWESLPAGEGLAATARADLTLVVDAPALAKGLPKITTRVLVMTPTSHSPAWARWALPGEALGCDTQGVAGEPLDEAEWATTAPAVAALVKALLLRATPHAPRGWASAWEGYARDYSLGGAGYPTNAAWLPPVGAASTFRTPKRRRGVLLVVGLGSLGSVAAQQLAPYVERMVLVDPDRVEPANVARQAFAYTSVGSFKADVLAQTIAAQHGTACLPLTIALQDEAALTALVRAQGIDLALLTTGAQAEFALARALSAAGIAHVAGRCYPRARFWEGIVVEGQGGPTYAEVRRTMMPGPVPLPTAEERAAYGALGDELPGEPATGIETGWAAAWLARLTLQLGAPSGLRERWFLARQAAGANCWIGGLDVEEHGEGAAYAVHTPGQVLAWTAQQVRAPRRITAAY